MFAAYVPIVSISGVASASTNTTVRTVTRKLSAGVISIVDGIGTTACAGGCLAGVGVGVGTGVGAVVARRHAAMASVAARMVVE